MTDRKPMKEPPDSDGTSCDGDNYVSPSIWKALIYAVPVGLLMGTVVFGLLYLFCDSCRALWLN